jgi:hypothetical protein
VSARRRLAQRREALFPRVDKNTYIVPPDHNFDKETTLADFVPFDEVYMATDWSAFEDLPAFDASNRGNAYRIYLEMEAESLK